MQPAIQAVSPFLADGLHRLQPLHVGYEIFSDHNPFLKPLPGLAAAVRENRTPVAENNPFFIAQETFSDWMTFTLNSYRDTRDMLYEQTFFSFYSHPLVQALLGLKDSDAPPRPHPGIDPGHLALLEQRKKELRSRMNQGGPREALLRALLYVNQGGEAAVDERQYAMLRKIRADYHDNMPLGQFKELLREQFYMLKIDQEKALATLPELLAGEENDRGAEIIDIVTRISTADGSPDPELKQRLKKIRRLLLRQ